MTTSNKLPLLVLVGVSLALVGGGMGVSSNRFRGESATVNQYLQRLSRENIASARRYHCVDVEQNPELDDGGYPELRAVRRWKILRSEQIEQQVPDIGVISSFNVFARVNYSNTDNMPIVGHVLFSVFQTDEYAAVLQSQSDADIAFSERSHCIDFISE